jgi:hypothetical protein
VLISFNGITIQSASVVMGAVALIPWRSREAEQAIAGKTITVETAAAPAEAALNDARPLRQNAYKIDVAKTRGTAARNAFQAQQSWPSTVSSIGVSWLRCRPRKSVGPWRDRCTGKRAMAVD